jgi:hypothetical protein
MMEYYTCSYNCFKTLLQNHFTVVLLWTLYEAWFSFWWV